MISFFEFRGQMISQEDYMFVSKFDQNNIEVKKRMLAETPMQV